MALVHLVGNHNTIPIDYSTRQSSKLRTYLVEASALLLALFDQPIDTTVVSLHVPTVHTNAALYLQPSFGTLIFLAHEVMDLPPKLLQKTRK